ncbi:MAG: gamma-glutamylcyclotransferase [Candidatus Thorarchaeota archaeon]
MSENQKQDCDRLFTYGTLQSGYNRNYLMQGLDFKEAVLPGYCKISPPELGFPFIIQDQESSVSGEIYFRLTQTHWTQIDLIEGEGSLYHRILVEVETIPDGIQYSAFTYYPSRGLIEQYSEK